jgi:hypothetical protein
MHLGGMMIGTDSRRKQRDSRLAIELLRAGVDNVRDGN